MSSALISALTRADLEAVQALLEPSGLHVELEAELSRDFALPWLIREAAEGPPLAFLLAWNVADELHLLELASHPEHRRRGFAAALLSELLRYARAQHKRLVLLEVRQSNRAAIALYERFGFGTTGVRRGYYSDTAEDALEMRLTLNPETGETVPNDA